MGTATNILISYASMSLMEERPEAALSGTAALMARVAQRDESALGELYDATSRLVYGLVLRLVHERATAEDLTMEVYLQVWRTAQSYNSTRGSVNSWLITVARSRAIDYLRSSHARFAQHRQSLDAAQELRDGAASPEVAIAGRDRAEVVRKAMDTLPPEQRQLIELGYYSGLSHTEIAEQLGLPLGTVKSRIRTAMLRLREMLSAHAESA
jgi:RNA polymerase sigma-70 factor (ECF subfamily)